MTALRLAALMLIFSLYAVADELCPLEGSQSVRLCPVCSSKQAGVRWSASTSLFDLVILFKCTDSLGDEVNTISACSKHYDGVLRRIGTGSRPSDIEDGDSPYISRIHVIDGVFSHGVSCSFEGTYTNEDFDEISISSGSCTINGTAECADSLESCQLPATCTDNGQECACHCNAGYENESCKGASCKNGLACNDLDECDPALNSTCDANAECYNVLGGYQCQCHQGFLGNGSHCSDINECEREPDLCHDNDNANCTNTPGSYSCSCNIGFSGDGFNCTDVNECIAILDECHSNATCINTDGSYTCTCDSGFTGDGFNCTNINECVVSPGVCHSNAACQDTEGSYECTCFEGYEGDGFDNCTDVDECEREMSMCHNNATCTNTFGGYNCSCGDGFTGDGFNCTDIDECAEVTDNCHPNATCMNIEGSFTCTCDIGFSGDGVNCTDIDECTTGDNDCDISLRAACTNLEGSYDCQCRTGYGGNGTTCVDIDECVLGTHTCDTILATCNNTEGSFECSCDGGYEGDGTQGNCSDVDECADGTSVCNTTGTCLNTNGSYRCQCYEGYSGDGTVCTDVDECDQEVCSPYAECNNTDGSFTCHCQEGFTGDGLNCKDASSSNAIEIVASLLAILVLCSVVTGCVLLLYYRWTRARRHNLKNFLQKFVSKVDLSLELVDPNKVIPTSESVPSIFEKLQPIVLPTIESETKILETHEYDDINNTSGITNDEQLLPLESDSSYVHTCSTELYVSETSQRNIMHATKGTDTFNCTEDFPLSMPTCVGESEDSCVEGEDIVLSILEPTDKLISLHHAEFILPLFTCESKGSCRQGDDC